MTKYNVRPARESDKWTILDWRNHPDVRSVMLTDHIISKEEHSAWWSNIQQSADRKVLLLEKGSSPVAVIMFNRIDMEAKTAWWGFYLDNKSLSDPEKISVWMETEKAVLDYAGKVLGLYEIYGDVVDKNQSVLQLHKKFGFVECDAPLGAVSSNKNVIYVKYVWQDNKPDNRPNMYLCASHNTDFMSDTLKRQSQNYIQFPYQLKRLEFGRYQFDLLDKSCREVNEQSSVYIFIERLEDLFADIYTLPTESVLIQTELRVAQYFAFVKQIALRGNKVYVADFAVQKDFPLSIEEQLAGSKIQQLIQEWNDSLYALKTENLIEVVPYSQVLKRVGQGFSNKYWYMARCPFSIRFLDAYSQSLIGSIFAANSLSARALVLDLDNTLWKGVIGDDGKDGITLGGEYPGNIYKELQSLFYALKERGILLTICSKNTEEVAMDAIESHPDMRLRKDDFVTHRINWAPKSQNIKDLSKELNLGLQSLCFIDDNPVERAEVRRNTPGVFVPELPEDPADWYQFICNLPELYVSQVSESDKRRAELYKKRVDIEKSQTDFADRTAFIKSLEMDILVEPLAESNFERTHQLFNKTNQFNTATTRYSKEQLSQWIRDTGYQVLHIRSKDKYSSEYEGVAAIVVVRKKSQWMIDNFVMSCRVMGRDIEHAIIKKLLNLASAAGIDTVVGRFVASEKNMPVSKLYLNNNFTQGDDELWVFNLNQQPVPEESQLMRLHWNVQELLE